MSQVDKGVYAGLNRHKALLIGFAISLLVLLTCLVKSVAIGAADISFNQILSSFTSHLAAFSISLKKPGFCTKNQRFIAKFLSRSPVSRPGARCEFTVFDGSREHLIIQTVRLPRSIIAMMVGAAMAT